VELNNPTEKYWDRMTLIDVIVAMLILSVFFAGFSQIFLPAYNAWNIAVSEYNTAHTLQFLAESFRKECAKPVFNTENWNKIAATAKELESFEISELWREGQLVALKAVCIVAGEHLEIVGLCIP
jgi:type II secretory pathway pseudopilin PulG